MHDRPGLWNHLSPTVLVAGPARALDVAERERLERALRVKARLADHERVFEGRWREFERERDRWYARWSGDRVFTSHD
jgi:hypothetical protein